ncbi:MAG: murein biosynthesis integral membrane protein MurJ [Caldilineaceae bacterium]|nr:murein biosynthesis integral membrane protein MurJ [Caldilineaceae bacterium]
MRETQSVSTTAATSPAPDQAAASSAPLSGRRLAGAALIVMFFFVLSRVTGLAREIVIGAQFGTSPELDAYLAAFRLPDLLFQLVAGGALGSAFIPTFATDWAHEQRAAAWLLFSRVLNLITLILLVVALVIMALAGPLVTWVIAPGFTPEQQALTAQLLRLMLLSTVIFGASGLIMGALNATQHFLLPAAAPVFYNVAIILGAWFLTPTWGIFGLVIGVVVGAGLHLLVQLPGLRQLHARYTPTLTLHDARVREVMRLMGPRVLGLFFVQMHFLVNTILASGLASGSLSALNYAWLLMLLPQGIFAQSIATAIFPTFATQVATGQVNALRHSFGQLVRIILFFTIPAALVLYLLRTPLVALLFQRREFTSASTALVGAALQFYAIGLVAHALVEIAVRAFYAMHNTWTPVAVGIGAMVINIGLSFWWVQGLGHGGLALANSTATTLEMLLLLWLLRRHIGNFVDRRLGLAIGRQCVAAGVMSLALWLWLQWQPLSLDSIAARWVVTLVGLFVAAGSYLAVAFLLRSEELQPALAILRRRR